MLRDFGYLDRYFIARDVVNFDQLYLGQTAKGSLNVFSEGFTIGMFYGFRIGATVAGYILTNLEEWSALQYPRSTLGRK